MLASTAPSAKKQVLVSGVPVKLLRIWIPPATVYSEPTKIIKGM